MVTVPLVNGGPGDVHILSIRLRTSYFDSAAPSAFGQDLGVGQRVDFPVGYGAVRCGAAATLSTIEADIRAPDGRPRTLRLTSAAGGVLARLNEEECDQRELEGAFRVEWGTAWSRLPALTGRAQRIRGELRLQRVSGDEQVTVTEIRGSVLFDLATVPADGRLPVQLYSPNAVSVLPMEIGVRMCSKHGLTEAKKIFDFTLSAKFGSGLTKYRAITPPPPVQKQALALLSTCPAE
jgi:hypothetical protein